MTDGLLGLYIILIRGSKILMMRSIHRSPDAYTALRVMIICVVLYFTE